VYRRSTRLRSCAPGRRPSGDAHGSTPTALTSLEVLTNEFNEPPRKWQLWPQRTARAAQLKCRNPVGAVTTSTPDQRVRPQQRAWMWRRLPGSAHFRQLLCLARNKPGSIQWPNQSFRRRD